MTDDASQNELYQEMFGSILDRTEMTPYLLKNCSGYDAALCQATKMMANRGFDTAGFDDVRPG